MRCQAAAIRWRHCFWLMPGQKKTGREIHAVTVDHGLRVEAAAEAAFVAMVCNGLDIVHTTLSWDGVKPGTGVSAAARTARYDLLEEFAHDIGVRIIISGHTSDDQAETVLMRMRRSPTDFTSGGRGHAGMCRRTLLSAGTLLLRPFLQLSRERLRRYLKEVSQSWIEDPSNHDTSYERIRVRGELKENDALKRKILRYSAVMGRMRQVIAIEAAALLVKNCKCNPGHVFELEIALLQKAPHEVLQMAIKTVIATAGGGEYLVGDLQLAVILSAVFDGAKSRTTLGNCVIECGAKRLLIYREARNLNSQIVEAGESVIWDGRVHITNDSEEDIRIQPMSQEYLAHWEETDQDRLKRVRKAVLLSSPLITTAPGLAIPVYFDKSLLPAQLDVRTGARAIENFCPQWDFALLEWLKNIDLVTDQRNLSNTLARKNLN